MNQNPFEAFVSLIDLDRTHQEIHKKLLDATKNFEQHLKHLEEVEANQASKELLLKKKRLELTALQVQMLEYEKKLKIKQETCGDSRSHKAAQLEITYLEKEIKHLEESIFLFFEQIETLEKQIAEHKKTMLLMQQDIEKEHGQYTQTKETLAQQLEDIASKRIEISKHIEPILLKEYDVMRQKIQYPAAEIIDNSCSGCFALLNTHDLIRAKNRARLSCKNCYRMLYMRPLQ